MDFLSDFSVISVRSFMEINIYVKIINPRANGANVPGVSPWRGLLIVHKRSSKSQLFMGDGDEIFLIGHDVMLTLISTIWRTIMNG